MATHQKIDKVKVLQFICPTGLFGAERWILALAKNYIDHDCIECQLAVTHEGINQNIGIYYKYLELDLRAHKIQMQGKFDFRGIFNLYKLLKREKIDIIHTHGYKSDIIGLIAARFAGIKAVATPHGFENAKDFKLHFFIKLGCFILKYFNKVAPLSEQLLFDIKRLGVSEDKIKLIINGVDLREVESQRSDETAPVFSNPNDKHIGYVGQIAHRKNIDALISTFDQLYTENKNIRLIIIGEGPQRKEFEDKIKTLESGSNIEFLGYRDDRLRFVKELDLFSMTSSLEGIPRCMMEAMAMGVPVAAFRIPGIDKLIDHGKTGLLADFNNISQLKECWREILFNEESSKRFSINGRAHILANFSAKRMAEEYCSLFQEVALTDKQ